MFLFIGLYTVIKTLSIISAASAINRGEIPAGWEPANKPSWFGPTITIEKAGEVRHFTTKRSRD